MLSGAAAGCTPRRAVSERNQSSSHVLTAEEKSILFQAEQVGIQQCMRGLGFEWVLVPENPIPENRSFPYGIDDVTWARAHGYGSDIQEQIAQQKQSDPNRRYANALPDERRRAAVDALNGVTYDITMTLPNGMVSKRSGQGCLAAAERGLYGDLGAWSRAHATVSGLTYLVESRVLADSRYAAAAIPWAACMRQAGYDVTTPAVARGKFADRVATPESRTREIATAVAEANCAVTAGLSSIAKELDRQYSDQLRAEHRVDVDTEIRMRQQALPRARLLLHARTKR